MLGVATWLAVLVLLAPLALIVAVVGALALPVRVRLVLDTDAERRAAFEIAAIAGFVRVQRPRGAGMNGEEPPGKTSSNSKAEKKRHQRRKRRRLIRAQRIALLRDRVLRRRLLQFVRRELHAVRIDRADVVLVYGLIDPADTGMTHAALLPITRLMRQRYGASVALHPDFSGAKFSLSVHAHFTFSPLRFLIPAAGLGLAIWRARRRAVKRATRAPTDWAGTDFVLEPRP